LPAQKSCYVRVVVRGRVGVYDEGYSGKDEKNDVLHDGAGHVGERILVLVVG